MDDLVKEPACFGVQAFYMQFQNIFSRKVADGNDLPMQKTGVVLDINEYRFYCLIHSGNALNYRNERLLQIANQFMPDLQ